MTHAGTPPFSPPPSDLACERCASRADGKGVLYREREWEDIRLCALRLTEEGGRAAQKPPGRYLSLSFPAPALWSEATEARLCALIAGVLLFLLPRPPSRVLIAGLGNRRLTADAFGPLTADGVTASAALPESLARLGLLPSVRTAVFVPDVFARTGIDSACGVIAAARLAEADAVVAIDALAAAERDRLLSVLEMTDTGTVPGGGVKRGGSALCEASVGVPVVFLGLPTVTRVGEEHFLVPRSLETDVAAVAALTARGINAAFDGSAPSLPFSLESLFFREDL